MLTMTGHVLMCAVVIHLLMFVTIIGMNEFIGMLLMLLLLMVVVTRQHWEMTKVVG